MSEALGIGVAGLGTVGVGLLRLLAENGDLLAARCGRAVEVRAVSARDRSKDRGVDFSGAAWYDDATALAGHEGVEIVVELIGGEDGVARAVCEAALARGRHVVTANKALLAHHGTALAGKAEAAGLTLAWEAAVAGGIPVVKTLREGLAGNRVESILGILNGTCNYILTVMRETGKPFDEVLADAQALGYAEADPAFDIDGVDAAHKLALLASLAFGCRTNFAAVHREGIREVTPADIGWARELGYRIKLLAIASRTEDGITQRVHPCLVPLSAPIAHVEDVFNAVVATGNYVDSVVQEGRGAGAGPTASAVIADILDIARGRSGPAFGLPAAQLADLPTRPMAEHTGACYIRLRVLDRPGVVADIAGALRDEEVSMEAMVQRGEHDDGTVPVIITTHVAVEAAMRRALDRIGDLDTVVEPPCMIRIESL